MKIKYHKLVRDRIPEIIEASGNACKTEILSDKEYLRMLDAKLDEELAEYHKDQNIEELADLLEVIYAVVKARGYTVEQLESVRAEKAAKRGGFEKRILLKTVCDGAEETNLADRIVSKQDLILEKVDVGMLRKYCWLQENLHKRNVATDMEYRKKFSGYYRMRFVSQEYRDRFFALFEVIKTEQDPDFSAIAEKLFSVDQKHEFSFISKMLHTIDPKRPIYDSQVDAALNIQRTYYSDFAMKVHQDEAILKQLTAVYRQLDEDPKILSLLNAIDRKIPGRTISTEKKLDFILWALGIV